MSMFDESREYMNDPSHILERLGVRTQADLSG